MAISYKKIYLFVLIFVGFYIFFNNVSNLNFKKNIIVPNSKTEEIQKKEIFNAIEKQVSSSIVLDPVESSVTNLNEKVIAVKKGQTFSEILDNFLFNFNKFEIINLINSEFNLKGLKVNQKISFFSDENNIVKKIIIDLDFKTILVINLLKNIEVYKKELNTFSNIESK